MEMEVKIDEEGLADKVSDAILASVLGPALDKGIREAVEKALKGDRLYGHPSIVERVVNTAIERAVREFVNDRFEEVIKPKVQEQMTDEFLRATFSKMFEAWAKEMGLGT